MPSHDREAVRRAQVRQLFLARYPEKRSETDILIFFGWLAAHRPELLPKPPHGDPYQHLKADLRGLYDSQT